ncbi:hypothetical protein CL6EHI_128130 [Entamoeba histolytica]|uniref:Mic1 domain-containing protein n=2 Tax=Entamoeba histolytica TaxID=5759 RepID=C4M527_ENTH1|nr:hypothetical protein EHI_128130 [Entamoeba histolytica HM-1:IMSS]EAL49375.2 hypothetical protein EHI_128130 [Entamoeba histolytica HM-1:IMSS]GAT96504.1 hypothetical protein CL6EHI_128130 [Entamoeba histolytica]|eukprot:XP_654763.2 hypothetical protein EHI_128130 [Entamoeba histolytica HM-1:IMSS]
MNNIIIQQEIDVPITNFLVQSDGQGGVYFHDKETHEVYQYNPKSQRVINVEHQFVGAILFTLSTNKQAFITKKQTRNILVKSNESKTPSLIKVNDDSQILYFVNDKKLMIVGLKSTILMSLNTFIPLYTYKYLRPWKIVHYKNIVVTLYNDLNKIRGIVLECIGDTISVISEIDVSSPSQQKVLLPTTQLIVIMETPYLAIHFNVGPIYLFNLNNPQEHVNRYESLNGKIIIMSIDDTLVVFDGKKAFIHNIITSNTITHLALKQEPIEKVKRKEQDKELLFTISNLPPKCPIHVIDYQINIHSTLLSYNSLLIDQFNSKCTTFHFNYQTLNQQIQLFPDECSRLLFFVEHHAFDVCKILLEEYGKKKISLWVVCELLRIVVSSNLQEFDLQIAVQSLIKSVDDSNYIVDVYLEAVRASAQTNEGVISDSLQADFIQKLNGLNKFNTITEFIQHYIINDSTPVALMLCKSSDETVEKYGFDMLKRIGDYKTLIDCLICKGRVVEAVRFAEHKKLQLDKTMIWEALAKNKNEPIQYQLQWFFLDHQ